MTSLPAENFAEIVKTVSQTRSLEWKQTITLAPAAERTAGELGIGVYNGAPIAAVEQAYKAVGLLPASEDLRKSLMEFSRLESLVNYDRSSASATWSPATRQLSAFLVKLEPERARDLVPVLTAMEALQEQHFHWRTARERLTIEDRRAAFAAVAAGDALLAFMTGAAQKETPKLQVSDQVAAAMARLAGDLPEFLRRRLTFPYRHGSRFVYWAFKANGWRGVNGIYADPPLSTAEILQPEKYFVARELPLRLFPPQLLRRFKQPAIIEQTLGEDAIGGLLTEARPARPAEEIAAAWRGDQLFHFVENGNTATVWLTAWRTDKDADEFFRAYWATLEMRHRVRFEMAESNAPAVAGARDRGWLLQRADGLVLMVSGSPAIGLHALAADTWKDLEMDSETIELRFESARAPAQFSVRSR